MAKKVKTTTLRLGVMRAPSLEPHPNRNAEATSHLRCQPLIDYSFQHVERHRSVLEDDVVEFSHVELVALFLLDLCAEFVDFEFADCVGEGLAGR